MKTKIIILFLILALNSCKQDEQPELVNEEYQFITNHILRQKLGYVNDFFFLNRKFEYVKFDDANHYEIIFKNSGIYYGLPRDSFKLETVTGSYTYDNLSNRIEFLGLDSIIIYPGYIDSLPEGGVLYLNKADWVLSIVNDSTLEVMVDINEGIAAVEIQIWASFFYLEQKIDR